MKNNNALIAVVAVVLVAIIAYFLIPKTTASKTATTGSKPVRSVFSTIESDISSVFSNGYFDNWDFLTDGSVNTPAVDTDSTIGDSDGSNDTGDDENDNEV